MSDHGSVAGKTCKLTQPTKKLDCPVTLHLKKLYRFPTFEINNDTKWNRAVESQKIRTFKVIQSTSLTKRDDSQITADIEIGHLEYITKFLLKCELNILLFVVIQFNILLHMVIFIHINFKTKVVINTILNVLLAYVKKYYQKPS